VTVKIENFDGYESTEEDEKQIAVPIMIPDLLKRQLEHDYYMLNIDNRVRRHL
jgi:hypothetical protein